MIETLSNFDPEDLSDTLARVQSWAHERSNFDSEFIDSLVEHFEESGYLSDAQLIALDNIIQQFNIEI